MTVAVQSSQVHKNYVAGAWVEGAKIADDINPSDTNDVVGRFAHGDAAQADAAVKAAKDAFPTAATFRHSRLVREVEEMKDLCQLAARVNDKVLVAGER